MCDIVWSGENQQSALTASSYSWEQLYWSAAASMDTQFAGASCSRSACSSISLSSLSNTYFVPLPDSSRYLHLPISCMEGDC